MTPTDPNPAREADGRSDRDALVQRLQLVLSVEGPHFAPHHAEWLADNRDAVLRALNGVALEDVWAHSEKSHAILSDLDARAEAAEAELERLHSWQGLLELLDEHWPEDIFETGPDDPKRDTGPRLVSALRRADKAERKVARVEALAVGPTDESGIWPCAADLLGDGSVEFVVRLDDLRAALEATDD